MKKKIIYLFIMIFSVSLISSAKKSSGCGSATCCQLKQMEKGIKDKTKSNAEPASLSLFFFNI